MAPLGQLLLPAFTPCLLACLLPPVSCHPLGQLLLPAFTPCLLACLLVFSLGLSLPLLYRWLGNKQQPGDEEGSISRYHWHIAILHPSLPSIPYLPVKFINISIHPPFTFTPGLFLLCKTFLKGALILVSFTQILMQTILLPNFNFLGVDISHVDANKRICSCFIDFMFFFFIKSKNQDNLTFPVINGPGEAGAVQQTPL